jgi:predicted nucleic acid-binding protein
VIELADTSAWTSSGRRVDTRGTFGELLRAGDIATCDAVRMELLRQTQDADEFEQRRSQLAHLRRCPISERAWRRALDVMHTFSERGPLHHRQVPIVDLLIAAAAELAELPVLHYDRHFELIAEVTGQPVRPIAPLGSL